MTLHATINSLAAEFAHELLRALRGASLDEIIAETAGGHKAARGPGRPARGHGTARAHAAAAPRASRGGKRVRRSANDLAQVVEKIISLVKSHKKGINAEAIRASLKLPRKQLPRPIAMALASKKIKKKGQKRATMYFAA